MAPSAKVARPCDVPGGEQGPHFPNCNTLKGCMEADTNNNRSGDLSRFLFEHQVTGASGTQAAFQAVTVAIAKLARRG